MLYILIMLHLLVGLLLLLMDGILPESLAVQRGVMLSCHLQLVFSLW